MHSHPNLPTYKAIKKLSQWALDVAFKVILHSIKTDAGFVFRNELGFDTTIFNFIILSLAGSYFE